MTATQTLSQTNGSAFEAEAMANMINEAYIAGHQVIVNGREAKAPHWTRRPAHVYGNGTVEVNCLPRTRGARAGYTYIKHGETAQITVL